MMNLLFEPTRNTPLISFNYQSGVFEISGNSIPENAQAFFKPVLDWLEAFQQNPPAQTIMKVKLKYYNTSTSKYLLNILKKLETVSLQNSSVLVEWYYDRDDEDMIEAGEDYESILKIPFSFIVTED